MILIIGFAIIVLSENLSPWDGCLTPLTKVRVISCTVMFHNTYVEKSRPPLWSSGQSSWLQNGDVLRFL
jgi:hypothetical protein